MFPTPDMNPIAVERMRRDRLAADIAFVERKAGPAEPGARIWVKRMAARLLRIASRRPGRAGSRPLP